MQCPRIRKDEADIKSLIDMTENNWLNKLYPDESVVVSLSNGTVAPLAMVKDLPRAFEVGEETYKTFKLTILDDDPPSVKFQDNITKQRLKTFSTISTKTSRKKGQNMVLKADRNLFSQMILVAESRSVNMKDVLEYPLGPLPWALANADGSLLKMYLLQNLSKLHRPVSLMGLMNGNNNTFAQLVDSVLSMVLYVSGHCCRVDVFFEVCRQPSIKDSETEVQAQPFSTNVWQGDTTYSIGENAFAVPSTRQASSSSLLSSGNYSDTDICCKARHCL